MMKENDKRNLLGAFVRGAYRGLQIPLTIAALTPIFSDAITSTSDAPQGTPATLEENLTRLKSGNHGFMPDIEFTVDLEKFENNPRL